MIVFLQGAYYVASGMWPLVHLASFYRVTGPKTDDWLVKTVGVVTTAIGLALLAGARRSRPGGDIVTLAILAALAYASIDFVYGLPGRIRFVYVIDGCAQLAIVLALAVSASRRRAAG